MMKMYDVVLIGGGIMSCTAAKLLKELKPDMRIAILESQNSPGTESSNTWNNAGTGHAGLCELNFTPEVDDKIDISKALHVTESFEISKQFWAYLVEKEGYDPNRFIHQVAHMSFVDHDVAFLKKRFETMSSHHFYDSMEYSENWDQLKAWMPLVMQGRNGNQHVASTHSDNGTDLNYGNLTDLLWNDLINSGVDCIANTKVVEIKRCPNNLWYAKTDTNQYYESQHLFIGAGGASISLLEKTNTPESKGYAGFPVSGQFLVCKNKDVIAQHQAKVYGKAEVGAPPMSVPHLDTRNINGKKQLLFGPFAGFSTKFLKNGSRWDFFKSIKFNNIYPMISAGLRNLGLTKYLAVQLSCDFDDKIKELKRYYPEAKSEDWELTTAGMRVQIIKPSKTKGGIIEFGTEIITSADGTLAALLGASPGASTSVDIMIQFIEKCYPEMKSEAWIAKMKEMIPSYGESLIDNKELYQTIKKNTDKILLGK
jgi:malate dehydrogenase (quinone)